MSRDLNLGQLGEKRKYYLCDLQPFWTDLEINVYQTFVSQFSNFSINEFVPFPKFRIFKQQNQPFRKNLNGCQLQLVRKFCERVRASPSDKMCQVILVFVRSRAVSFWEADGCNKLKEICHYRKHVITPPSIFSRRGTFFN